MNEEIKLNFYKNGNFYIYGDIDDTIPENIIAPLFTLIKEKSEESKPTPINVFISSQGGDLNYALEIINLFDVADGSGVKINTIISSQVCSAASLIAICGHNRIARRWSSHLIHHSSQWDYSHNPEMAERNTEYVKFINKELLNIYKKKTKIKDLDKKIKSGDYIISGQDLLKYKLVDVIQ